MPFFIVQVRRSTWLKHLVETEDIEEARRGRSDGVYLGYADGLNDGYEVVGGPFPDEKTALNDESAYTEGR